MLKDKEYYEFNNNGIYEVDKNLSEEEKSIFLLLKNTMRPNTTMRKNKELEFMLGSNIFKIFHLQYLIFNNIHIKDENNNLLFCKSFYIDYSIDRNNRIVQAEYAAFEIFTNEDTVINRVRISDNGEKGKIHLNLSYNYDKENEIADIIGESFFDIIKQIVIDFKVDLYKHLNLNKKFILTRVQDFLSLTNKIEDEKRIKKFLIENNFK